MDKCNCSNIRNMKRSQAKHTDTTDTSHKNTYLNSIDLGGGMCDTCCQYPLSTRPSYKPLKLASDIRIKLSCPLF